jgi:hypothetical protein
MSLVATFCTKSAVVGPQPVRAIAANAAITKFRNVASEISNHNERTPKKFPASKGHKKKTKAAG